ITLQQGQAAEEREFRRRCPRCKHGTRRTKSAVEGIKTQTLHLTPQGESPEYFGTFMVDSSDFMKNLKNANSSKAYLKIKQKRMKEYNKKQRRGKDESKTFFPLLEEVFSKNEQIYRANTS
ncbi:hypothetical protein L9F63_007916, partial [Diploptera punctata]